MRIVLCYEVQPSHVEQIQQSLPEAEVVNAGQQGISQEILTADIFCGHAKVPMPWPQVVRQQRLQWIQSSAAGLDHCLVPSVIDSEILVTGASGLFADQVAEHTLALLTALLRKLPVFFRASLEKEFVRRPTDDLHHKTVGIVGFGGNGQRIAEVLAPLRTRILATDVFPDKRPRPAHVESIWQDDRLDELLPMVDILILSVPLTDQTRGMIDRTALGHMKRGAALVNVARGPVVVEEDLVEALQSGQLGGAALDVTEVEPLPPSSPLWNLPQVIITPHVAAQSARRYDDVTDFFCANLHRFRSGEPLLNRVDKKLGFPRNISRY